RSFSTRSAFTCTRSKWPAASFCSCSVRRCFSEKWTRKREDRQRRDAISRCFRWRCLPSPGGAMMAGIVLAEYGVFKVPERIETGVVLLVVLFLTYLLLLFSDAILPVIGRQGASVLVRIMGRILLLSGSGNRAYCARCRRLDNECAALSARAVAA